MKYLPLLLMFFTGLVHAGSIQLDWTPPTEREDGSALSASEIASYKVYYNTDGTTAYPNEILVTAPASSYLMTVPPGDYNIVLTTIDQQGRESIYSSIVTEVVDLSPPKPPTGLTATIP